MESESSSIVSGAREEYRDSLGRMPSDQVTDSEIPQSGLNPKRGQRQYSPSVSDCLLSLTWVHNETVNVYSHALGCLLFVVLPVYLFRAGTPPRYRVASGVDVLVCSIYFCCASISFLSSALSHTFLCYSERITVQVTRIHSLSLILLLWGANIPLIYYSFFCDVVLQISYWAATSLVALICLVITLHTNGYNERPLPLLKVATVASLAASIFAPVTHSLVAYGLQQQVPRLDLQWLVYTLIGITVGFAAHALMFPEFFYPGTFDIVGSSHQILHVMVLGASIVYTIGLMGQVDYVHDHEMRCPA